MSDTNTPGKVLAVAGAPLLFWPVLGLLGTVFGISHAFQSLGSRGIAEPSQLAASMQLVLLATAAGFLLALAGLILLIVSLVGCRYRAPWLFWFLVIYGALIVMAFPVGTILGASLLIFCFTHKQEFLGPEKAHATA